MQPSIRRNAWSAWQPQSNAQQRLRLRAGSLTAFLLVMTPVLVWLVFPRHPQGQVGEDLCPSTALPTHTAVLVDLTDRPSDMQLELLHATLHERVHELGAGSKLSIWLLTGNDRVIKPLFAMCRPPRGNEVRWLDSNPRLAEKSYDAFIERLNAVLAGLGSVTPSAQSPVIEAFYFIARDPAFATAKRRQIIAFSDLLERTPHLNQFKPPVPTVDELRRRGWAYLDAPALAGADVSIFQFSHHTQYQTAAHQQWWQRYWTLADVATLKLSHL